MRRTVLLEDEQTRLVEIGDGASFEIYSRQTDPFDNEHWELETSDDYRFDALCGLVMAKLCASTKEGT